MYAVLNRCGGWFDRFEEHWESLRGQKILASFLVLFFLAAVAVIELNRRALVPPPFDHIFSRTHLAAIEQAFNLLLAVEVVSLILSLVHSVSRSVGKQFEVFSLILLRGTFKNISHFDEPLLWEQVESVIVPIVASAAGALLIFVILGFFYRLQKPHPLKMPPEDRNKFILAKKLIALALLTSFLALGMYDVWSYVRHGHPEKIFEMFYTLLIFSDVLIVLISLRYSSHYLVAFRNSGFAVATMLIRLALLAPTTIGAILGVGTALFALGITIAYNAFVPVLCEECVLEKKGDGYPS
ncbi:MAG: hypothetical protein AB1413_04630 [Thermodesulfobacteriota bacterium]